VPPGGTATFAFSVRIPDGLKDGTLVSQKFSAVFPGTDERLTYGSASVKFTADQRQVFTAQPAPTITGTVAEDNILTAKAGNWRPTGATISYAWMRDGKAISGASASTYVLTDKDVGRTITLTTKATAPNFITVTKTSGTTARVTSKHPNRLSLGERLDKGDQLVSRNGKYSLVQRHAGALVFSNRLTGKVLWSNKLTGKGEYTLLTPEGSLVSYSSAETLSWSSRTAGRGVAYIALSTDGKLSFVTAAGKTIRTVS